MMFALGVVLFALGIGFSVALHEAGHMWTAQKLGMKVRRYYIGFGPKIFSWRRGETEYGLKAIPAGGFCDIAGMTAVDELAPDEVDRAMFRQKTWKRLVVMFGGIGMNFVLGFALVFALALGWGLPDRETAPTAQVGGLSCAAPTQAQDGSLSACSGPGPAQQAGLQQGDVITSVNGTSTPTSGDVVAALQPLTGTVELGVVRDDRPLTLPVQLQQVQRYVKSDSGELTSTTVGAVGMSIATVGPPNVRYNVLTAIPGSLSYTGYIFGQTAQAIVQLPAKVGALWTAITGGERDINTPISVVGASVIGGQAAERGLWEVFVGLLATLNFFLGAFNLLPLLPLDGGHIAVTIYEGIRNKLRFRKGLPAGRPVDYMKLMPATYVVIIAGGAFMLLTLTADIVNPIQLFQ
ncbi:M50 family metallopeptidase [Actinomycetes bacterium M1A6_2h]